MLSLRIVHGRDAPPGLRRQPGRRSDAPACTSPSSWTATAAGRSSGACRAPSAIAPASPRFAARWKRARPRDRPADGVRLLHRELEPAQARGLRADGPAQGLLPQRSGAAGAGRREGPHRRPAHRASTPRSSASSSEAERAPPQRPVHPAGRLQLRRPRRHRRRRAALRRGRRSAERRPSRSSSEERFEPFLSTAPAPAPDLIIRTSGERRLSNFLLWECAYAELVFQDVLLARLRSRAPSRGDRRVPQRGSAGMAAWSPMTSLPQAEAARGPPRTGSFDWRNLALRVRVRRRPGHGRDRRGAGLRHAGPPVARALPGLISVAGALLSIEWAAMATPRTQRAGRGGDHRRRGPGASSSPS